MRVLRWVMVAARDEPGRIEIELTSRDTGIASTESEPLVARSVERPRSTGDGRRLLGTAAAVGLVGLVIGVVIGRAGSGGSGSDDPAAQPTAPVATLNAGGEPIAPPPSSIALITRLTTTTTLADRGDAEGGSRQVLPTAPGQSSEQVVRSLTIDASVGGLPIEVVGVTVRGELVRLDLTTGRTTTQPFADAPSGPSVVLAGDGWIARPSWDARDDWLIVRDDGLTSRSAMGDVLSGFYHGTDGRFWAFEQNGPGGVVTEVALDGAPTGRAFEIPGFPEVVDPSGAGIVVSAPGGTYVVGEDGSDRVTTGDLLALGRQRALAFECDNTLACAHVVIDRATGDRRPITLDRAVRDRTSIRAASSWTTAQPFNLAEDAALVITWDQLARQSTVGGVLDLDTGELIEITERGEAAMMRWLPGGESVLWLDRGRLRVFDLETRTSTDVSDGLDVLTSFTIRTALPSVEAATTSTTPTGTTPSD